MIDGQMTKLSASMHPSANSAMFLASPTLPAPSALPTMELALIPTPRGNMKQMMMTWKMTLTEVMA
jgi:hypothetical protein